MAPVWNTLADRRGELLSRDLAPDIHAERWARRYDGTIGELNRWVDHVRDTTYENIPYFDPAAATEGARVLVLLQDPSGEAEDGSGFISKHNNDPTAHNTYLATDRARLDYAISLHWNVVPWWVANPAKPRGPSTRRPSAPNPTSSRCSGCSTRRPPRSC